MKKTTQIKIWGYLLKLVNDPQMLRCVVSKFKDRRHHYLSYFSSEQSHLEAARLWGGCARICVE